MLTPEQKEARKNYLGSSDAPAVLKCDPFRSAADVWLEKTGRVDGFAGNEQTRRGDLLEAPLVQFAVEKVGHQGPVLPSEMRIHANGLLAANYDALLGEDQFIEAKTTGISDGWGDEGTDDVPQRVLVQTAHAFAVMPSLRIAWVPVLMPGYASLDFRLYRVERDDELVEVVEKLGREFMTNYVRADVPPDDFKPSLSCLHRMKRVPNKIVPIDQAAVMLWRTRQNARIQAEKLEDEAKAAVLSQLGDAEGGQCDAGLVTFMETKRKAYQVAEASYRVMRWKAAK